MNWVKVLEEIGNKVGILAALFAGYIYLKRIVGRKRVSSNS